MQKVIRRRLGVRTRSNTVYVLCVSGCVSPLFPRDVFAPSISPPLWRQRGGSCFPLTAAARSRIVSASVIRPFAISHTRDSGINLKHVGRRPSSHSSRCTAICRVTKQFRSVYTSWLIFTRDSVYAERHSAEWPDVKNYKWRLNPVWHRMLYRCTHMATVGVKGLTDQMRMKPRIAGSDTATWRKRHCRKRYAQPDRMAPPSAQKNSCDTAATVRCLGGNSSVAITNPVMLIPWNVVRQL